jgi:hypothetical protein
MLEIAGFLDVWSNIAYVAASLFCLNYILKSRQQHTLTIFFSIMILCIACGSSLFHAYGTPWAQLSDVIPCWTFMMTYIATALHYMLGISKIRTLLYMAIFTTSLAFTGTFHLEAPSVPWIPAGVMLWVLSVGLYNRQRQSYYSIGLGALCFTIGLSLKSINPWITEYASMGTHWLWHMVTALMLVYLTTGMHDCFLNSNEGQKQLISPQDT